MEGMKYVEEKLREAFLVLENLGGEAMAWFNGVFPPETMPQKIKQWQPSGAAGLAWLAKEFPPETRGEKIYHWLHITKPYLTAAGALVVLVMIYRYFGGGGSARMMKAPGRKYRMARADFESDPKGYFRDLHARK